MTKMEVEVETRIGKSRWMYETCECEVLDTVVVDAVGEFHIGILKGGKSEGKMVLAVKTKDVAQPMVNYDMKFIGAEEDAVELGNMIRNAYGVS